MKTLIITLSDRASRGEYEDRSGPEIESMLQEKFQTLEVERVLIGDEPNPLREQIQRTAEFDVIITTGGTGIGARDITPDVVNPMLDREIPGIMEFIRCKHGERLPSALLSRSVAGVIGTTLVYTLPGNIKAVREYMAEILRSLEHAQQMIQGIDSHCSETLKHEEH
ncbi:MogA/MoaB family molybdenum cofactor biosynthesis protein [Pontiellaceae bacterium B1224]|nr:MogA/MoaB family molybdenum cofactor biosynthesis protein [Pontiellaceae bacterium B1224]